MSEIKHPAIRYHGRQTTFRTRQAHHKNPRPSRKKITALPPNTFPAKRWLSYYVRQIDKEIRGQL